MILQSLVQYYESMSETGEAPQFGFSSERVSFAVELSESGEVEALWPLTQKVPQKKGAKEVPKEVPQELIVPRPFVKSSGIKANFLFDNPSYILGFYYKNKKENEKQDEEKKKERTGLCFEASGTLHREILEEAIRQAQIDGINIPEAEAVLAFFNNWEPEKAQDNEILKSHLTDLSKGGNLVFRVDGRYVHEVPAIKKAWIRYLSKQSQGEKMVCLVTGEKAPASVLHGKIKGVAGVQPSGGSLISFNELAYESYGRKGSQGLNAPVSEYASFAFTEALNSLLKNRRKSLGDTSVVYWAKSGIKEYQDIFEVVLDPSEGDERTLKTVMSRGSAALPVNFTSVDMKTPFYILGLAPNAGRISVRFFLRDTFGNILENLRKHYERLEIEKASFDKREFLSVYWLLQEIVSSKAKNATLPPILPGAVMRSIFMDLPYPEGLYYAALNRTRCEQDDKTNRTDKVTRGRAALIKACLLKKKDLSEEKKEVLTVSLNEESTCKSYVLGRLFAILEKAQKEANPDINTTIKNRFFTSACATPGMVFPTLLKLAQAHIDKSDYGCKRDKDIEAIMDKLSADSPFPSRLDLEEQGLFILGYYHQRQSLYRKKEN